jgi:hypothetical protein
VLPTNSKKGYAVPVDAEWEAILMILSAGLSYFHLLRLHDLFHFPHLFVKGFPITL